VLGATRGLLSFLWRHRRLRVALLACLIAMPLLSGGWLLLRNSPLVSVDRVRVTGVHGANASAIETALSDAARHMSTLDVHVGALRAAVAPFRVVRDLRVSSSFPHALRIKVIEQLPVAALSVGGTRTAVAADGVVLGPALLSGSLAAVTGTAAEPAAGQRVKSPTLLASLAILGAAPTSLARMATRVYMGSKGLTVTMRNGLRVYFGDAGTPRAKWLSLARVLADQSSAGASYVDVRLPERPAAGFSSGSSPTGGGSASSGGAPEGTSSTQAGTGASSERGGALESTAAALAAGLKAAGGKESTTAGKEAEKEAGPRESTSSATSESAAGAGSESTSASRQESSPATAEGAPREGG
jgi:cell division protein FtsQ